MSDSYDAGLDILGAGIGDIASFIPALGLVKGLVGGGDSGAAPAGGAAATQALVQESVRQALVQQKAQAKAEAEAKRTRTLLYTVLGILGIGGAGTVAWLALRKRR